MSSVYPGTKTKVLQSESSNTETVKRT